MSEEPPSDPNQMDQTFSLDDPMLLAAVQRILDERSAEGLLDPAKDAFVQSDWEQTHAHDMVKIKAERDEAKKETDETKIDRDRAVYAATHDALTGSLNIVGLEHRVKELKEKYPDRKIGVLFFDLDGFKPYNDSVGHTGGDDFLIDWVDWCESTLRHENGRPGDVSAVSRAGGDEFVVVAVLNNESELSPDEQINGLGNRLNEAYDTDFLVRHPKARAMGGGVSWGGSVLGVDESLEEAREIADQRMYRQKRAKQAGRS